MASKSDVTVIGAYFPPDLLEFSARVGHICMLIAAQWLEVLMVTSLSRSPYQTGSRLLLSRPLPSTHLLTQPFLK